MPATATKMLELVSPNKSLWLSLSTNEDDYNNQGGMRTVKRGQRFRFDNHRASVEDTPQIREQLIAHKGYGRTFFFKDDSTAPPISGGVGVVSGQMHGASNRALEVPPTPEWDTTGARDLRVVIASIQLDLQAAMAWESSHLARDQVIRAIGIAIRDQRGDPNVEDEPLEADTSEGRVRSLPDDPGGL